MNDIARHFLETYARGAEVEGGWKFDKALRQSRLDGTPGSLPRLDQLLARIREHMRPTRADFVDDLAGRNFCALLAFQLMDMAASRTAMLVDWYDAASARAVLPSHVRLPDGPASCLVAIARGGDVAHLPLAWIHDTLFGPGPSRPAADWVAEAERQLAHAGDDFAPTAQATLQGLADGVAHGGEVIDLVDEGSVGEVGIAVDAPVSLDYAGGTPVRVGDAVLADGGVVPARVVRVAPESDGRARCVVLGPDGVQRSLAEAAVREQLVFVGRNPADPVGACVAWLDEQAQRGDAEARHALGLVHWRGLGVPRNAGLGLRHHQIAADANHAPALTEMARIHLEGDTVPFDRTKGLDYLQRAVDRRHPAALTRLGRMRETGEHMTVDLEQAGALYRRAIKGGDVDALVALARLLRQGRGVPLDPAQAMALLAQAAAAGSADAQYELARCHDAGDGVAPDHALALRWYDQAAAQGHARALATLADKYEHGDGVAQDLARAVALHREAAGREVVESWFALGCMAAEGRGMPRDMAQAAAWMQRAAARDVPRSRALLAEDQRAQDSTRVEDAERALAHAAMLEPQALVDAAARVATASAGPDLRVLAFKLLMQAARRGHVGAQFQVADAYRRGVGVDASPPLALEWLERAALQDHAGAIRALGEAYESGELGARNTELAFGYSLRSARSGTGGAAATAAYRVARMYEDGRGATVDLAEALRWMETAADHGVADAEARVATLRRAVAAASGVETAVAKKPGWKFW